MTSNPLEVLAPAADAGNPSTALRREGLLRLQNKEFAEAAELLARAKALAPDDRELQLNLGLALQNAGRHAEALEHFAQLQKSTPQAPASFLYAATSLLALGRPDAAFQAAGEACSRAPQLPQAFYVYGQALLALNQPKRAEEAFAAALQKAPSWPEGWISCGIARYRQGAIEGAKAAMRQALQHAPDHPAARANLDTLMRVGADAGALKSPNPRADSPSVLSQAAATSGAGLGVWKPKSPPAALSLAVEFLRKEPVFAKLPFGEWAQVLIGQVHRGHFFFVADQQRRVHGFLGWALTTRALAEEWVASRSGLRNEDCREGECVIINAWVAHSQPVNRFIVDRARDLFGDKETLYFKRFYPDGRARPMRLATTDFVESHLARAATRHGAFSVGADPKQRDENAP